MRKVVYIIEDNEDVVEVLKEVLSVDTFRLFDVFYFRNHFEAIRHISHKGIGSIAVWDINTQGFDLLDTFQQSKFRYSGHVVLLSGHFVYTKTELNTCFSGPVEFLNKPFQNSEILEVIMRVLYPGEPYLLLMGRLILASSREDFETNQVLHIGPKNRD
jgi:DNA-binding NtrC family response regulator